MVTSKYLSALMFVAILPLVLACSGSTGGDQGSEDAKASDDSGGDRSVTSNETVDELLEELTSLGFRLRVGSWEGLPVESLIKELQGLATMVRAVARQESATPARCGDHVLLSNRLDPESFDSAAVRAVEKKLEGEGVRQFLICYPVDPAISRKVGEKPLPVVFVPRAEYLSVPLRKFQEKDPSSRALPHAGTVLFRPFRGSSLNDYRCAVPTDGTRGGPVRIPRMKMFVSAAEQGKVVSQGKLLEKAKETILRQDGDLYLGGIHTYLWGESLYFVRYELSEKAPSWTWAVPIADANGAARLVRGKEPFTAYAYANRVAVDPDYGSCYENQVSGLSYGSLDRHNLLVLPRPRPIGSDDHEARREVWKLPKDEWVLHRPQERVAVNREFLAKHPIVVLRKGARWRPFMEDVSFDEKLSFHGADADTALVLVISADAPPERVKAAIAAYFGRTQD